MAHVTGILSSCTMCVQLSANGTAYVDHSDSLSVIEPPEMTRITGDGYVFGEDTPIVTTGKREPVEIRLRGVYVDGTATTNAFGLLWGQYTTTCGGNMYVRWAPAGCTTDNQVFSTGTATTDMSELISLTPPGGEAAAGEPLMFEAVIKASALYRATWAA